MPPKQRMRLTQVLSPAVLVDEEHGDAHVDEASAVTAFNVGRVGVVGDLGREQRSASFRRHSQKNRIAPDEWLDFGGWGKTGHNRFFRVVSGLVFDKKRVASVKEQILTALHLKKYKKCIIC